LRRETAQNSERTANERSISTDTGKKRRRAPRNACLPQKYLTGEAHLAAITCL
jgi:hypothetical protein